MLKKETAKLYDKAVKDYINKFIEFLKEIHRKDKKINILYKLMLIHLQKSIITVLLNLMKPKRKKVNYLICYMFVLQK